MREGIHLVRVWGNCNRKQTEKQKKKILSMKILREKINVVSLENPVPNKKRLVLGKGREIRKVA